LKITRTEKVENKENKSKKEPPIFTG